MKGRTKARASSGRGPASRSLRILIANGVNLDLLGTREPEVYGKTTLAAVEQAVLARAEEVFKRAGIHGELAFLQSNDEGEFLAALGEGFDGILINAGAWTHTSLALADRLKGLAVPYVEVHISNTFARESFRHHSYLSGGACGIVVGFGVESYLLGMEGLVGKILAARSR